MTFSGSLTQRPFDAQPAALVYPGDSAVALPLSAVFNSTQHYVQMKTVALEIERDGILDIQRCVEMYQKTVQAS